MSKRAADHERFVGIMHSIARAEEMQQRDKLKEEHKPPVQEERNCLNCERKKSCRQFNGKTSISGTYSIGGDVKITACDKWKERKDRVGDPKKIKSLLKQFSKKM
jgi:hypothetical protein